MKAITRGTSSTACATELRERKGLLASHPARAWVRVRVRRGFRRGINGRARGSTVAR